MKNLICLLALSASLILWNCKKDRPIEINTVKEPPIETPTELNVKIEKYGLIYVTNEDISFRSLRVSLFGDSEALVYALF